MPNRSARTWLSESPLGAALGVQQREEERDRSRHGPLTRVPQAEVQQELQRFAGRFTERVMQAAEVLADTAAPPLREQALRRALLYEANALDIATGPVPDINLLDMLVFITLVRDAFHRHWGPQVFGADAEPMLAALTTSEKDAWFMADRLLSPAQQAVLREQIHAWEVSHPEQVRVEAVRLSDFAELAGEATRSAEGAGLLANVRVATQAADQALLLGERALFLVQRAPSLLRLQLRLGAQELLSDSLRQLDQTEVLLTRGTELLQQVNKLKPVLERAADLTDRGSALAGRGRELLESAQTLSAPLMADRPQAVGPSLTALENLAQICARMGQSLNDSLRQVTEPAPDGGRPLTAAGNQLERGLRRVMGYVALVGVVWAFAFWAGYYLMRTPP